MRNQDHSDDLIIINRIQNGDADAFGLLLVRYKKNVHNYIFKSVGDFHVAEDLTQDTFLKAWKSIGQFHSPYNIRSWLFKVAGNLIRDYVKIRDREALPHIVNTESEKADAIASLEDEPDTRPLPNEFSKRKQLIAFVGAQLDEILIERRETEAGKKLGRIEKRAFNLLVVGEFKLKEVRKAIAAMAQKLGTSLPSSFPANWKRDILKPLAEHIVKAHPALISDLIGHYVLEKLLDSQELMAIQLYWFQDKPSEQTAGEMNLSIQCFRELLGRAEGKTKKILEKYIPDAIRSNIGSMEGFSS